MSCETACESVTIKRGRTWKRRFFVTETDTGDPVDLTDAVLRFQVKKDDEDANPALLEKIIGDGITLDDQAVTGIAGQGRGWGLLVIDPADTADVSITPAGLYRAELVVEDGDDVQSVWGPLDFFIEGVVILPPVSP